MSGTRTRTPGTPTKMRTRREQLVCEEIPTRDIAKSKSVGGTPKTRRLIQNSAVRRSWPEAKNVEKRDKHFRRHSENREYIKKTKPSGNDEESRRRSLSQSNLVDPNVTNNSIISSDISTRSSSFTATSLSKNIYKMWKHGQLCDVTISAGGTQFHVHRLVLAATCERFATSKQSIHHYDVPNVSAEVMDEVLDFFYTSKLNITSQNVEEVLEISQNIGVKKLLDMCIDFLKKINLTNAVRNRAIAQRYGLNSVISTIDKYVHEHFSTLMSTSSFLESDFNYIYDIISSDILTKPDELKIFHACAKWIEYKCKERIKYAIPLISLIRFGLIPASQLVSQVEPVTMIFDIPECKDMLYSAFRHHALFEESKNPSRIKLSSMTSSRNSQILQRINSKPKVNCAVEEQETESSESSAESSETTTSNEDQAQISQSVKRTPSVQRTSPDYKSRFYSEVIQEFQRSKTPVAAHVDHSGWQMTGNSTDEVLSNASAVPGKNMKSENTPSVSKLSEKFSNISMDNKHKENANFLDTNEPTIKKSESKNLRKKIESNANNPRANGTQESPEPKRVSSITSRRSSAQNGAADTSLSATHVMKSFSKERHVSEDNHAENDRFDRKVSLKMAHRNKSHEMLIDHHKRQHTKENSMVLSPIRSVSAKDLPPPPVPQAILIVGGACAYDNNSVSDCVQNCIQQFDPDLNTWQLRSRLPVPVHYSGTALIDMYLYLIGGRMMLDRGFAPVKDCFRYDIMNDRWERIASLRTARSRHSTLTLNGTIFVIGGRNSNDVSCKTAEFYNHASNSWGLICPMKEARVGAAAAAHRGRLFVAGGMMDIDEKLVLNTMEIYDPCTKEWTFRYPLPVAVCGSSMVEIAGALYLVGGYVIRDGEPLSLDSIFRYTDEADSWEGYKTLHVPRHNAVVVALDSKLYIVGGESSAVMGHALSNVECIDVETDRHVTGKAPLLTPAYGISGCVLSN